MQPDWMPLPGIRKGLRELARGRSEVLTNYGSAHGAPAIRQYLLRRMTDEGLSIGSNQVMLTTSASQSLDLVCRLFLRPGDTVLIDDPCYYNFQALFQAHRATVHSVPYTANGPDLSAFEAALKALKPRLYVANSAIHNPTGATMTPQTVHRLLALSVEHDLTVVEDDVWADLEPEPSPRMAVLDGLERVLRIGSFTKTISASARCGYIAAREDWIEALVDMQLATNLGGPSPISTELIASVITSAAYPRYLADMQEKLSDARNSVADRLAAFGIEPWIMPRGGFLLWCRFPEGIDTGEVAQRCIEDGVVMAPGNVFSPAQTAGSFMRFNVTQMNDRKAYRSLEKSLNTVVQRKDAGV
jgi:DNA-binding transcriptional MocR family regulator